MKTKIEETSWVDFVKQYLPLLDEFDLRDLFKKLYTKVFNKETGLYVDKEGRFDAVIVRVKKGDSYSSDQPWAIDFSQHVVENIKALKQVLKDRGVTWDEFFTYYNTRSLVNSYHFRRTDKSFSYSRNGNSAFVYFLRWLVNGTYDENWKEANDFLEERKISYNAGRFEFEIGNIKVKSFENGRLDLKGLTPDQEKKIDRYLEIHKAVTLNRY